MVERFRSWAVFCSRDVLIVEGSGGGDAVATS
jgi:hypothetical protein